MLKFSKSHEWVKEDAAIATIGITDYAQKQLGDIVFIELPQPGAKLQKSEQLGTIESTKTASELYVPLSGEIVEVNSDLVDNPQWINESPYDKGWLVKLKITNHSELNSLMDESTYRELIAKESH
ncbi:MAG: glycine cleavage system protein GcvH [Omnitrophica bacterium]|nr:glycine cleavage system protein GcvH [Candidatus Omnitrophota bacterium]